VFARRALLIGALVAGMNGPAGATEDENREKPWRLAASVYGYVVPDEPDFVMAIVPVEIGGLHLEGRYNYEAVRSGAAFAGVNAGWGKVLAFHVTPMIGGVVGDVDGLVPALRLTLAWRKLDLYSESEVVIDFHDAGASFFYDWSELGVSPIARVRFGAAAQRSRVFHTPLDIQRGLFASVTIRFLTVTLYEFNAGWTTPTWVGAVTASF